MSKRDPTDEYAYMSPEQVEARFGPQREPFPWLAVAAVIALITIVLYLL